MLAQCRPKKFPHAIIKFSDCLILSPRRPSATNLCDFFFCSFDTSQHLFRNKSVQVFEHGIPLVSDVVCEKLFKLTKNLFMRLRERDNGSSPESILADSILPTSFSR